jgi:hypothetical protein
MSGRQLTVEPPDFDKIKRESGQFTADGIRLLWLVANDEADARRTGIREASERWDKKVLVLAPTVNQNNLSTQDATILRFDGASAVNITGIRARVEGAIILISVLGTGTITLQHDNAGSDARNRMLFQAAADKAVLTNKDVLLKYLNTRWREVSLA